MLTGGHAFFRPGDAIFRREAWLQRHRDSSVRTSPPKDSFAIDVQTDASLVARQWEELEPFGTVFQTRAWLMPWYRIVAPRFKASPLFVTVSQRETHRPLMFFPLCLRLRRGLRIVEFADLGVSDYNAPIMAPGLALDGEAMKTLWKDICRSLPRADIVRFTKVPEFLSRCLVPLVQLSQVSV